MSSKKKQLTMDDLSSDSDDQNTVVVTKPKKDKSTPSKSSTKSSKRSRADSDSDSSGASDSDSDSESERKRRKKAKAAKRRSADSDSDASDAEPEAPAPKKAVSKSGYPENSAGEICFKLSDFKHVTLSSFRGVKYVNIREYYNAPNGQVLPTKKGIMLNAAQWAELVDQVATIDRAYRGLPPK
ncbi:hypothetical protein, variant [Fonticula alba]|uniref:Transcriptional coactivator p15 (PC4) C-terminal domain-containing protein n=1 Tax=Fonticula alba TaxID=691883 RepID=A0A058ZBN4_FONAL|nr:hypothetical protein, variant [Fonticula alba]KCV71835.1 hypothetical protein, variant [Fonticula alba]|eukprot:XP_009493412.1 hypothetical protein, variant [Fonticula alba]